MIDNLYIKDYIPPISKDSLIQNILNKMEDFQVEHLALVENNKYVGLIGEEQLLDASLEVTLGSIMPAPRYLFIMENQHFLEAASIIKLNGLSAIPIINEDNEYKGMITKESVYNYMTDNLMTIEKGSVLVLEAPQRSYSVSELSRVCESENAKIYGLLMRSLEDKIEITLKLNSVDIFPISSTLEKMGYTVVGKFIEGNYVSSFKDHYDYLINYLNL